MRKALLLIVGMVLLLSCDTNNMVRVMVSNTTSSDRTNEMIEVSMKEIDAKLGLADTTQIVVLDARGKQLPYQITYNDLLIFPVTVNANDVAVYSIEEGTPETFTTLACGNFYPERKDDVAWENDLTAYRAYGPALQQNGERAFGYDVWTKYNTSEPVVEARYARELDPETLDNIAELRKTNPSVADSLYKTISYHIDHGNGLDCYKVGPTLGCGASGLMVGDSIVYPYAFTAHEILDNGPLRFTVKLVYNPFIFEADSAVVETRLISLDAYSYMNKASIYFSNLTNSTKIATGLVLHEPEGEANLVANATVGYITYVDPTDNPDAENGKIFVGAAFPNRLLEAKAQWFSEKEKNVLRGGADGHVLAVGTYKPNSEYIYYFGSAWSKSAIETDAAWNQYVENFAKNLKTPLTVTIK